MAVRVGVNGQAKNIETIYVGDHNNKAKEISAVYIGINGKAKLVYENTKIITYTVAVNGSQTTLSDRITLTFSRDPGDISRSDIIISGHNTWGSVLEGSGVTRTIAATGYSNGTGSLSVSIPNFRNLDGKIEKETKTVSNVRGRVTYTVSANGSQTALSSRITLAFNEDPGDIARTNITVSGHNTWGNAIAGTGATRTIDATAYSNGTGIVSVAIPSFGRVESGTKTINNVRGRITYSISANGSGTVQNSNSTQFTITFNEDPGTLPATDVRHRSNGTGVLNAWANTISGSGTTRNRAITGIGRSGTVGIDVSNATNARINTVTQNVNIWQWAHTDRGFTEARIFTASGAPYTVPSKNNAIYYSLYIEYQAGGGNGGNGVINTYGQAVQRASGGGGASGEHTTWRREVQPEDSFTFYPSSGTTFISIPEHYGLGRTLSKGSNGTSGQADARAGTATAGVGGTFGRNWGQNGTTSNNNSGTINGGAGGAGFACSGANGSGGRGGDVTPTSGEVGVAGSAGYVYTVLSWTERTVYLL